MAALLLVGGAVPAFAQANLAAGVDLSGPRATLDRLLALNAASAMAGPEGRALLTGELAASDRATVGRLVPPDALLALTGGRAVARIPAHDDDAPDLYLYLRRQPDGRWAIEAVRTLAVTGIPRELRRLLRAMPHRTDEQEATLRNTELILAPDRALRAWFGENRTALERLRRIAEGGGPATNDEDRRVETAESARLLGDLHATMLGISRSGTVTVTIGGVLDNSVGFLHATDPASVPPIDPGDHIWIEPLGDGWYLFRTT